MAKGFYPDTFREALRVLEKAGHEQLTITELTGFKFKEACASGQIAIRRVLKEHYAKFATDNPADAEREEIED